MIHPSSMSLSIFFMHFYINMQFRDTEYNTTCVWIHKYILHLFEQFGIFQIQGIWVPTHKHPTAKTLFFNRVWGIDTQTLQPSTGQKPWWRWPSYGLPLKELIDLDTTCPHCIDLSWLNGIVHTKSYKWPGEGKQNQNPKSQLTKGIASNKNNWWANHSSASTDQGEPAAVLTFDIDAIFEHI